jgi:hypothetical protein
MTEAVFNYCDARGVSILQDLELKITPPNEFNDPFEFRPRVTCSSVNRKFKHLVRGKDQLRGMFVDQEVAGFSGNFRQFKKQLKKLVPQLLTLLRQKCRK